MTRHRAHVPAAARTIRAAVTALLALTFTFTASAQLPTDSYQGPLLPDPSLLARRAEPVWRDRLDSPTAVVTESAVVYLRDGRLVATELASGWQQWSYGSGLTGPLLQAEDLVILADGGRVTALDAADGTQRWSTQVTELPVRFLETTGTVLVAGSGAGGYLVLDLRTGAPSHTFDVPGVARLVQLGPEVAIFSADYGEPNVRWYHAYSTSTGEELWRGRGWLRLLGVMDGRAYLLNQPAPGSTAADARFSVSVVDATRGTRSEHWQYEFGELLDAWHLSADTSLRLTGEALYVTDPRGGRVFSFPHGGAGEPTATYAAASGAYRAGPYLNLLFFEGEDHNLLAAALDGGRIIEYLFPGTLISRLDLVGTRAYVGRADGTHVAVDLTNARVRHLLRTNGTGFGPTLTAGGYVVVQGSAEVLVLEAVE